MRIITDDLFNELVKILAQDPKVAAFQKLILAQKAEPAADDTPDKIKTSEVEK